MYDHHGGDVRIAVVAESYEPSVGPTTASVRAVLSELASLGHDVIVVAPGRGPTATAGFPVVRVAALSVPWLQGSPRIGLPMVRRLQSIIGECAPDVVLLAAPAVLGMAAAVAARRASVPTVAVLSTDLAGFAERHLRDRRGLDCRGMVAWDWLRRVHALVDRTLVPCATTLSALKGLGLVRLATWPQGVDLGEFSADRRDDRLRTTLGAPGRVLVGYVGPLTTAHRVDLLPSIAALPDVRLVVAGSGPAEARLRRLTPSAAHLGGLTSAELAGAVASLDVLVSPGVGAGAGDSILHALAAGVPVVAAVAGRSVDLVRHGRNGILVETGSARALALGVGALSRDPVWRGTLAARARASVEDRSWRTVTLALLDHLSAVAGRPAVSADAPQDLVAA